MGYLFLSLALLSGATKGFCGKKTSGFIKGTKDSILSNIIRMLLCIAIGFVILLFSGSLPQLLPSAELLLICALSGISTAVFVVTWLISVQKSAYMMLDVFLMLGVLIPIICGNIFFNETVKLTQWIGIAVLFVAVVIMCSYNNTIKQKITIPSLLLLIACGLSNGITDFSQKLFIKRLPDISVSVFNFYTYIFAALTLVIAYFLIRTQEERADPKVFLHIFGYVFVLAACLFANSYFKTLAANHLDAVLLYPLNQGAGLILSSVMAAVFFREKLTAKCITGLIIAFIGLLIINLL